MIGWRCCRLDRSAGSSRSVSRSMVGRVGTNPWHQPGLILAISSRQIAGPVRRLAFQLPRDTRPSVGETEPYRESPHRGVVVVSDEAVRHSR